MKPALHAPHVFGVSTHGPRLSAVQLGACEQFVLLIDDDTALIKPRTASAFPDDNADVMPPFRNFEGFTDAFTTTAISALVLAWERYTSKARAMMVTLPSRAWRPAGSCAVTDGTGPTPRMISGGTLVETASLHVRGNGAAMLSIDRHENSRGKIHTKHPPVLEVIAQRQVSRIVAPARRGDEEVGLQRKAVVRADLHVSTCRQTDAGGQKK